MCVAVPESPVNDLLSNDNGHSADYRQAGHLMGNAEMVLPCACSVQRIAGARCAIVNCVFRRLPPEAKANGSSGCFSRCPISFCFTSGDKHKQKQQIVADDESTEFAKNKKGKIKVIVVQR